MILVLVFWNLQKLYSTESGCFSHLLQSVSARTIQALCCYPVTAECFSAEYPPDKCCPFALSHERRCVSGCSSEDLRPLSFDSVVRVGAHYPTLESYLELTSDANKHGRCLYQEIQTLLYGYMKAANELPTSVAEAHEARARSRLWEALRQCDLSDEEMWSLSHMTRPLMSYLLRYKNHFAEIDSPLTGFTRNEIPEDATAWDVGASDGEDTLYLLSTARGFRKVLAVEASPPVVHFLQERVARFRWRTDVVDKAVVGSTHAASTGNHLVSFSYFPRHSQVSQLSNAGEPPGGVTYRVGTTSCGSLAEVFGAPWMAKIDIEDKEDAPQPCLTDLCTRNYLPKYVSMETQTATHVRQLVNCGYKKFKLVAQSLYALYSPHEGAKHIHKFFNVPVTGGTNKTIYQFTSSGPLGEDAVDWISGHEWRTAEEVAVDINLINFATTLPSSHLLNQVIFGTKGFGFEWFDIHARLSP